MGNISKQIIEVERLLETVMSNQARLVKKNQQLEQRIKSLSLERVTTQEKKTVVLALIKRCIQRLQEEQQP